MGKQYPSGDRRNEASCGCGGQVMEAGYVVGRLCSGQVARGENPDLARNRIEDPKAYLSSLESAGTY